MVVLQPPEYPVFAKCASRSPRPAFQPEKRITLEALEIREEADAIAEAIRSDDSPVGTDAARTHVIIIQELLEIERRLDRLELAPKACGEGLRRDGTGRWCPTLDKRQHERRKVGAVYWTAAEVRSGAAGWGAPGVLELDPDPRDGQERVGIRVRITKRVDRRTET